MKKIWIISLIFSIQLSIHAKNKTAEDYYISAYNEISSMLSGQVSASIKRAVFLAEWAYYEGKLDYNKDFCDEIKRIANYINLFYNVNKLNRFKTGKQMALNEYFFRPYSGNGYKPYTYDFENFAKNEDSIENQFVSRVLKTHKGQCHSLPWMYKILAEEIGANVSIARAPGHCYIMYKDKDNLTPEEWINLELTIHHMVPSFSIKEEHSVSDSAIIVGTYMSPLSDIETIACQLADLALGYYKKFNRYDKFTYYCTSKSLEFYPKNPIAWIIRGKSLESLIEKYLEQRNFVIDKYATRLIQLAIDSKLQLDKTFMTIESDETSKQRRQKIIESQNTPIKKIIIQ